MGSISAIKINNSQGLKNSYKKYGKSFVQLFAEHRYWLKKDSEKDQGADVTKLEAPKNDNVSTEKDSQPVDETKNDDKKSDSYDNYDDSYGNSYGGYDSYGGYSDPYGGYGSYGGYGHYGNDKKLYTICGGTGGEFDCYESDSDPYVDTYGWSEKG